MTWVVALSFWNFRWWGILMSGALLFIVTYGMVAIARRWFPIITTVWKNDSRFNHAMRCTFGLAHCIAGYYFILGGVLAIQERTFWRFSYHDIDHFRSKYKGEEFKLVRQLSAYEKSIPNVELTTKSFQWSGGIAFFGPSKPNLRLFPKYGIYLLVGTGLVILANAVNSLIGTSLWRFRVDPAWRFTCWPIAAIGTAMGAGWCIQEFSTVVASLSGGNLPYTDEVRVTVPLAEARQRVERALQAETYSQRSPGALGKNSNEFVLGEAGEWWIVTIPEG
jgi:hypothetical protein